MVTNRSGVIIVPDRLQELADRLVCPHLDADGNLPAGKVGDDAALALWAWIEIKRLRGEIG